MTKRIHAAAGITAMTLVATFMVATIGAELVGDPSAVLAVKTAILFALSVLIPSVMIAGASGRSLAARRTSTLLRRKRRRGTIVAVVGITVLVPCAVVLRALAADREFGTAFVLLQGLELAGGATNLTLLWLNARAGRRLRLGVRRTARKDSIVGSA